MDKRYQVFISSTFADLEDERKEVMEAIIDLNCFPAGMEMFPAVDMQQFEYIKNIIEESDYYVLIIAGKYGSLDSDGISFTEKEYDYACEKKIPILAFIRGNIDNIPSKDIETDQDKYKKLNTFKEKVKTGRLVRFWENKDQLRAEILSSLSKSMKLFPRCGWVRGNIEGNETFLAQMSKVIEENENLRKENEMLKKKKITDNIIVDNNFLSKLDDKFQVVLVNHFARRVINISLKQVICFIGLSLFEASDLDYLLDEFINELVYAMEQAHDLVNCEIKCLERSSKERIKINLLRENIIEITDNGCIYTEFGKKVVLSIMQ